MSSETRDASVEVKLRALGDPSGQKTSEYWNAWFGAVSRQFEWYTGVEEIEKVMKFHFHSSSNTSLDQIEDDVENNLNEQPYKFIHAGSGNSLLPVHLCDVAFPASSNTVFDISDTALKEMQELHDSSAPSKSRAIPIQYHVGDVLKSHLPFDCSSFHAWIDKGLLDALFSGKEKNSNVESSALYNKTFGIRTDDMLKCHQMFCEAHRILINEDTFQHNNESHATEKKQSSLMLVVSMAEEHSLYLILSNWVQCCVKPQRDLNHVCNEHEIPWNSTLHIHELVPTSGSMMPFGFVLKKSTSQDKTSHGNLSLFEKDWMVELHDLNGNHHSIPLVSSLDQSHHGYESDEISFLSLIIESVENIIQKSRTRFHKQLEEKESKDNQQAISTTLPNKNTRMVLSTLEIKPADDTIDLQKIHDRITSKSWDLKSLKWYAQDENKTVLGQGDTHSGGIKLKFGNIVPIGFGIQKLLMYCIIDADDLECLCDSILQQESEGDEYNVQSIDVDWLNTVTVSNPNDCIINL